MVDLQQIKTRIYDDDRIEDILELLDCWDIDTEQNGLLYVAGLPDGDNKRSVQIRNTESLTCNVRSKGISGSIFDLVSYIKFGSETEEDRLKTLHKSKYWICDKLGYYEYIDDFYKETSDVDVKVKPNINGWLHKLNKKSKTKNEIINITHDDSILNRYGVIPYMKWLEEGLSIKTQKMFQVGIDVQSERITFPVHNKNGEVIGVKGRYCGKNEEIENNYKYLYIVPCNKSIELFNFHRALPHILKRKEVIVIEGGKTSMFLTQWNHPNAVSMEGDSLSDVQVKLLKSLGIDIKFVFAFDKDKSADFVRKEAEKLTGRMKFGIIDTNNYLSDKDSPTDKGFEVWSKLYTDHMYKI